MYDQFVSWPEIDCGPSRLHNHREKKEKVEAKNKLRIQPCRKKDPKKLSAGFVWGIFIDDALLTGLYQLKDKKDRPGPLL